ncbi:hypothetical protein F5Y11DRAFT_343706 [Daldinia sp. FL1419]|nr:hypothetical protein F5Y11DRAFT_343706 [Daldinia sp. FL1419]
MKAKLAGREYDDLDPGVYDNSPSILERFPGKSGRLPPFRGIVKQFGQPIRETKDYSVSLADKYHQSIIKLHQLGTFRFDPSWEQIIDGKMVDFGTTCTIPHFMSNPELNLQLTPEMISMFELYMFTEVCQYYDALDGHIETWNEYVKDTTKYVPDEYAGTRERIYST